MVRDAHRAGVEVEALVERGHLPRAVFLARAAAADGEHAAAGPRPRFEHLALVATLAELVGDRQPRAPRAEDEDAHARHLAAQIELRRRRRGEQAERRHRLVDEGRAAGGGDPFEEETSRQRHRLDNG
jgi:hypothetical protein